jgi:hypothetical protein
MNALTYDPTTTPPTGTSESRWELSTTPTGISSPPADTTLTVWNILADRRVTEAEPVPVDFKTIQLQRVVTEGDGAYKLVDRPPVRGAVLRTPTNTGKFRACQLEAGALLDSFFLGDVKEGYGARPEAIWAAALAWCSRLKLGNGECRRLSDEIGRLMCLRAGIVIRPDQLPL